MEDKTPDLVIFTNDIDVLIVFVKPLHINFIIQSK